MKQSTRRNVNKRMGINTIGTINKVRRYMTILQSPYSLYTPPSLVKKDLDVRCSGNDLGVVALV